MNGLPRALYWTYDNTKYKFKVFYKLYRCQGDPVSHEGDRDLRKGNMSYFNTSTNF